jgi:hypothetical protein
LARALHPDFGLFWPSSGLVRKLSIAIAFVGLGLIAGTNGILLLLADSEPDAHSAFALAPEQARALPPAAAVTQERVVLPASQERVLPPASTVQPQPSEPKIIRVERKPMQPLAPKIAKTTHVKSSCGSVSQSQPDCIPAERNAPLAGSETPVAATVPVPATEAAGAATLPVNAAPLPPGETSPTLPEAASVAVMPEPAPAPAHRSSRKAAASGHSRNYARESRSYSHAPAARRPSGGYAVLW